MAKAQYENHIGDDEFHPNPRIAARYADYNALVASAQVHKKEVARLEAIKDRSAREVESLHFHRQELIRLVDALCDYETEDE